MRLSLRLVMAAALGLGAPALAALPPGARVTVPSGLLQTGKVVDVDETQGQAYGDAVARMPNWNGVWRVTQELQIGAFDPATAVGIHDGQEGTDFGIAAGGREYPPYQPEVEMRYAETVRRAKEDGYSSDYVSFCRPQGVPRVYATPGIVEIMVTPKVTWMTWAQSANIRRIYTDGRGHPAADVSYPTDQGHSIGRWEGSTLVVDTVNLMAGSYDLSGAPYSDKLHLIERISMIPNGQLKSEITLEDPDLMTQPWRVTRYFDREPLPPGIARLNGPGPNWVDVESLHCSGNRNVPDQNGAQTIALPGDKSSAAAAHP
jgi:hypothetical protein